jgi:hypothetical protein
MVTASPMDGFLLAPAEALNALVEVFNKAWFLDTSFDNIFKENICFLLINNN